MPAKVYLGPNLNFWCNNCNIPILELKKCPICNSQLKQLQIAPPFEISPAFDKDIQLIRRIIDQKYGFGIGAALIPSDKIVLLNKAPYYDRMDEIIVDGFVLGNILFNPASLKWEFNPKIEGARRLAKLKSKKWIQIDDGAIEYIVKGANVLAPGVVNLDPDFEAGDYLIVLTSKNQAIATGPAKYSGKEACTLQKGMLVKTKDHDSPREPEIRLGGQSWKHVINANTKILEIKENQAIRFIHKIIEKFADHPVTLSFSGGKDSLCLLLLVLQALGPVDTYFIDTSIEFEETINFTNAIIKEFGLTEKFSYVKSKESFWENLKKFGPPAKDYRWCCKTNKLANITEFLNEKYSGKKVVTFIGSRQYESISRRRDSKVWTNAFLPQQIGVSPIHKWPALLVWMYLFWKDVKINPLYFEGYKRIGCIYCPANKLSDLQLLRELYPELYDQWMNFLKDWAVKYNLAPAWVDRGFWRWRKFKETGQINLASEIGVPKEKIIWQKNEKLEFHFVHGVNPCQDGSFSIEGRIDGYLDYSRIANMLQIIGTAKYSQELGVISLRPHNFTLNLFSDGTLTIRGSNKEQIEKQLSVILALIKRANECIGCSLCIPTCPENALVLKEQKIWVKSNCKNCLICLEVCPVLKYK